MKPLPSSVRTLALSGCLGLALMLAGSTSPYAGELLPFPAPERSSPYAQQSQRPDPASSEPRMKGFRQDIAQLPCPELSKLQGRLKEQFDGATTEADRDYYARFLQDLDQELANRCNK